MIQKYFLKSLLAILGLLLYTNASAQQTVVANDDFASVASGAVGQLILANALENDSIYESRANLSLVLLSQVSTENPNLNLSPDGSVRITQNAIAPGYYRIRYQICDIAHPTFCEIATIHVFIGICMLTELYSTAAQNCTNTVVGVYNLPVNDLWSIAIKKDNLPFSTVTGTGYSTEIPLSEPGNYSFQITNTVTGCMSVIFEKTISQRICRTLYLNLFGTYNDFNADQSINAGDVIDYTISIVNTAPNPISNIAVTSSEATISGSTIPSLAAHSGNNSAFTARHVITQEDIIAGRVTVRADVVGTNADLSVQNNTCISWTTIVPVRKVLIKAFVDANGNALWDSGETNFNFGKVIAQSTDGGIDRVGFGSLTLADNNTDHSYDISFEVNPDYAAYYTVNPNSFNDVHVPAVGGGIRNFAVTATPYNDVSAIIYNSRAPRPGFDYQNNIRIINNSAMPLASGSLTFNKDNLLTISSISEPGITPTENGFVYNFTNLQPFEIRNITVHLAVPVIPVVHLGDLLTNTVAVTVTNDIYPENNSYSLAATIVGSFDPNDKTESYGGKIVKSEFSDNDFLTYTIRFENTGTANAINVNVHDVLDDQLDLASLKMVEASHDYTLESTANELHWTFAAIDLPPSVENTNTGKGYIVFQIKPKPGFAVGDIIPNTADIYFDSNPAIVTDVCNTEFVSTLAVADFDPADWIAYPNPVKDNLNISAKKYKIDNVTICDISGKVIYSKTISNFRETIDLSFLSNGLYFAKVNSNGKSKTFKLIKE